MSPTYRTASRMELAALANSWEIVHSSQPGMVPGKVWGFRRGGVTIKVEEDRRGGLLWASIGRSFCDGYDCVTLPRSYRGKVEMVLDWLAGDMKWIDFSRKLNDRLHHRTA